MRQRSLANAVTVAIARRSDLEWVIRSCTDPRSGFQKTQDGLDEKTGGPVGVRPQSGNVPPQQLVPLGD